VIAAAGLFDATGSGFTLWAPLRRAVAFEEPAFLSVTGPNRVRVELAGQAQDCALHPDGWWVDGNKTSARVHASPDEITVFLQGAHRFARPDPLDRLSHAPASGLTLAPMPGLVKAVFVSAGQMVAAGDRLAVLEAMKMEHTLCAARAGQVAEVLASVGDQVTAGAALIRLAEEDAA
jgi:3-methylcrotonyl-CoA carboxylase alpha subunit